MIRNLGLTHMAIWKYQLLALALLFSLIGSPAWADDAPKAPVAEATAGGSASLQLDANDIPSETVEQFVQAYLQVLNLVEQREIVLQQAETEAESLQIQQAIQSEAFELIEQAGLTRRQYWQLLGLANIDPDFRERVLAQVEEADH